uniref:Double-motif LAGLIDADG homing endonuclease n=1 Tax=Ophiostoma novo-ulmi subsp. novo-ulmi TaxID=170179 RepID=A0A2L1IPW6_OPHNO|nr:double-motif LAGLIDADG homing endonuclease [Ophiostoma novo-ulmi subsp. novo-ulmi]
MWGKLSNSGELLKLLVLSYTWKCISGWSNSSDIVTIQMMSENEMDNRGSKSNKGETLFVKEQRVDGSWHNNFMFKVYSNGSRKRLSTQNPILANANYINSTIRGSGAICIINNINTCNIINLTSIRNYSSQHSEGWISGFVDAEGCFRISIIKNKNYNDNPWLPSLYEKLDSTKKFIAPLSVRLYFQIGLHKKDEYILKLIQSELKVGKIYTVKTRPDTMELQVSTLKDIAAIIEYFDKYPLITQKYNDYLLFKEAYGLMLNKKHLTIEGLKELVALKVLNNKGLTNNLKEAFPNISNNIKTRPDVKEYIKNPGWLSGFVSGEGSFGIFFKKSSSHVTGYQVQLRFQITQHNRDKFLMESIIDYLGCGYISHRGDILDFHVLNIKEIVEKVIPFFKENPILGVKSQNFNDFCDAAEIIKNKEHLTEEGITKLNLLKSRMNTLRDIS